MRAFLLVIGWLIACAPALAEPADSYAIVHEDATATSRVVAVRIDRRLPAQHLARIAGLVKATGSSPSIRHVQVSFYLPRMPLDQRPWASVDLSLNTRVTIGGLSLDEQSQFEAEAAGDRRAILGTWLTDLPSVPGRLTIYSQSGKTMLEWKQRGGTTTLDEVIGVRGTRAVRYDHAGGGGDYYLAKASGELEVRSADRLIAIASPLLRKRSLRPLPSVADTTPTAVNLPTSADASEAAATEPETGVALPPAETFKAPRKRRVAKRERSSTPLDGRVSISDYIRSEIAQ